MIVLFTDFGNSGPYIAQMQAAIRRYSAQEILTLFSDLPAFRPVGAGYLLAAYMGDFPEDSCFVCVVDPDVGSGEMTPVMIRAANRWFTGPDNGLFDALLALHPDADVFRVAWQPEVLSNSFHGRDLYAPVAAMLAEAGMEPQERLAEKHLRGNNNTDLAETIYIDHYGNVMTGVRYASCPAIQSMLIGENLFPYRRTFSDDIHSQGFCYCNANGLLEIAVNRGSAAERFGLSVGMQVKPIF